MKWLTALCARLSRLSLFLAGTALAGLGLIVIYGVALRYLFNDAPPFVEQVALLLVICVAMFGAAVGVHDAGHIGLDSLVKLLPSAGQRVCALLTDGLVLLFAMVLFTGSLEMGLSTRHNTIPTLGISEAFRYLPPVLAGLLVALFSIEHLLSALKAEEAN